MSAGFPGGTYDHMFYVADIVARGGPMNEELHVFLDEAGFLGLFPLAGEAAARLVGTVRDNAAGSALTWEDVDRSTRRSHRAPGRSRELVFHLSRASPCRRPFQPRAHLLPRRRRRAFTAPSAGKGWTRASATRRTSHGSSAPCSARPRERGPARHLRVGANRLRATARRHDRPGLFRRRRARAASPRSSASSCRSSRRLASHASASALLFAAVSQMGIESTATSSWCGARAARIHGRRSSPVGRAGARGDARQLHPAHVARLAAPRLRRAGPGAPRRVRFSGCPRPGLSFRLRDPRRAFRARRRVSLRPDGHLGRRDHRPRAGREACPCTSKRTESADDGGSRTRSVIARRCPLSRPSGRRSED